MDFDMELEVIPDNEVVVRTVTFGLSGFNLLFELTDEESMSITMSGLNGNPPEEGIDLVMAALDALRDELRGSE